MKTIAIVALLGQALAGPSSTPLEPAGKWTVDYAKAGCILSRNYGVGDKRVTLGLNPAPIGGALELISVAAGATTTRYRSMKGTLTLQPSGRIIESNISVYDIKASNQIVTTVWTESDGAVELLRSTSLSVVPTGGTPRTFALPGMKGAATALETCQDDLLKQWGIDPAERNLDALSTGTSSPAQWITNYDYPATAISEGRQGTSVIVWTILPDGKVGQCHVVQTSGTQELDDAACGAVVKRGRYAPSTGADGKPITRHGMRKVVWRLPS